MASRPKMRPWVGKSGPGRISISSSTVASGLSISVVTAAQSSLRLCGGMFVAIPTAIPLAPLSSRFGMRAGSTTGSLTESSKFGWKSTVLRSRSAISSAAIGARRPSV